MAVSLVLCFIWSCAPWVGATCSSCIRLLLFTAVIHRTYPLQLYEELDARLPPIDDRNHPILSVSHGATCHPSDIRTQLCADVTMHAYLTDGCNNQR